MTKALKGADAAIWCVGVNMNDKLVSNEELIGHENLLQAMKTNGVKRIITWATTSVKAEGDKLSLATVLPPIIAGFKFPNGKRELRAIAELLKTSDTDWTIVRFLGPKNTPYTGKVKVTFGDKRINFFISREDIGAFMVIYRPLAEGVNPAKICAFATSRTSTTPVPNLGTPAFIDPSPNGFNIFRLSEVVFLGLSIGPNTSAGFIVIKSH